MMLFHEGQLSIINGSMSMLSTSLKHLPVILSVHLRNEFNFWNVHGIMNTSGLLQSKECSWNHE